MLAVFVPLHASTADGYPQLPILVMFPFASHLHIDQCQYGLSVDSLNSDVRHDMCLFAKFSWRDTKVRIPGVGWCSQGDRALIPRSSVSPSQVCSRRPWKGTITVLAPRDLPRCERAMRVSGL